MRNILIGILMALWLLLGWMYSKDNLACCGKANTSKNDNVAFAEPAVSFEWNKSFPTFSAVWQVKKDSLLSLIDSTHILEIAGYRCKDENDSIGLQRAKLVREAFTQLEDNMVKTISVDGDCKEENKKLPFDAIDFNIRLKTENIVEEDGKVLVYFPENSADRINNEDIETYLLSLAERLKNGNQKITITGHTDDRGDAVKNQKLGQKRADAIKSFLVSKGVDAQMISATSAGESIPISDNATSDGRAANRRTEISF